MNNKRINEIVRFIEKTDKVIDVGCDHAYTSILCAKLGCKKILATDITQGALNIAIKNIKENNLEEVIKTYLTDGLDNIDTSQFNTIIISGMGTSTIKRILKIDKLKSIKKIILQSNNDLKELRLYMNSLGYSLKKEKIIFENNHYYTIMKYEKEAGQILKEVQLEFGIYQEEALDYYRYIDKKLDAIYKNIPLKRKKEREENRYLKKLLSNYLKKENGDTRL